MEGRIIGFVCCLLCAFPFFAISHYCKDSGEPINFWSGDNSLKDKIINIKEYNLEMSELYKKCSWVLAATGIFFLIFPIIGIVCMVLEWTIGVYIVWKSYKKIFSTYS